MNAQKTLDKMITVARTALTLARAMQDLGYDNSPYWDLYGNTADAIYFFIGESTPTFDVSVTYHALTDDDMTQEQRLDCLLRALEQEFMIPA